MIAFVRQDGSILGGCAADSPATLQTITKIPDGCTAVYVDDATYPNVWTDMGEYVIQGGVPVFSPIPDATKLSNAQQAKINQIRDAYFQTIDGGFNVTIGTTTYTFGWNGDDVGHMTATQSAVGKGFLAFPFNYADINGNPVNIPDQATLDSIESTATKFNMNNHQQALNLIGQVKQATTVSAVNAISWSPATY